MNLTKKTVFLVEETAFEGVKRIAAKVAADVEKVTGNLPEIVSSLEGVSKDTQVVFCATLGSSTVYSILPLFLSYCRGRLGNH